MMRGQAHVNQGYYEPLYTEDYCKSLYRQKKRLSGLMSYMNIGIEKIK